jgi:uncharacterized protein YndB with AHSA1/START domain
MPTEPIKASIHIEAPPEHVYEHFVKPEAMVRWMGDYAVLEPKRNGRFEVNVHGAPVRGRYIDLEPPHRLVISWGYAGSDELPPSASTVEVRLIADDGGTRVELEHRDLPAGQVSGHVRGWDHYMGRLRIAGGGGDAGPDPGM